MGVLASPCPCVLPSVLGWALDQSLIPPGFSWCWAGWRYQTVPSQLGCNGVVGLASSGCQGDGNFNFKDSNRLLSHLLLGLS